MPIRKIAFSEEHKYDLQRIGVTDAQLRRLERALPLILIDIEGYAPNSDIREALDAVHGSLVKAEKEVDKMVRRLSKARAEAGGHLAAGASSIVPSAAVVDIESAVDGAVPERVDVPTLLRLLVVAVERSLASVPKRQYRRKAPVRSIELILIALNQPDDQESRLAASTFRPGHGKRFVDLCSTVFNAAAIKAAVPGRKVSAERAIRKFLEMYERHETDRYWRRKLTAATQKT